MAGIMLSDVSHFIAVDIGNSRMKIGRFERAGNRAATHDAVSSSGGDRSLPEPSAVIGLPIDTASGDFDAERFAAWCDDNVGGRCAWLVASVHRGATERLRVVVAKRTTPCAECEFRLLTYRDVRLPIEVAEPGRVGIDRLLGARAADRLRAPDRAAIVVDSGSAITVDLLTAEGAFAGGAILPGIAMSARALAEQTDALPHLPIDWLESPPAALGKSTAAAIEAGLYWGAVGAIRELIGRLSDGLKEPAEIFLSGGASRHVAELLGAERTLHHIPHLVLSGIAVASDEMLDVNCSR